MGQYIYFGHIEYTLIMTEIGGRTSFHLDQFHVLKDSGLNVCTSETGSGSRKVSETRVWVRVQPDA